MAKLVYLDVFSGIGGISLAIHDIVTTQLYCELDPYCQSVLVDRMEDGSLDKAPIHSDITTLHLHPCNTVKMIGGGFPCQDISSIGLQKGIKEGHRSSLFLEIMRLVDENPGIEHVFLENVGNICKCGLKEVVNECTKRGFNMQWTMRSAGQLGAPHLRTRWFCFASKSPLRKELVEGMTEEPLFDWPQGAQIIPRVIAKDSDAMDKVWARRCQCLGNTVVPCVVRSAFKELAEGNLRWESIHESLNGYGVPVEELKYPYPDSGVIIRGQFYSLPHKRLPPSLPHTLKTTLVYNNKTFNLPNLPTPRRGIVHASTLTERSMHDLPTILLNCEESGIRAADKGHVVNVNFIEWMMGYTKDWTKVRTKSMSGSKRSEVVEAGEDDVSEGLELSTDTQEASIEPSLVPTPKPKPVCEKKPFKYNGMHVFMKEHPSMDIRKVASLWKELNVEQKAVYSQRAHTELNNKN